MDLKPNPDVMIEFLEHLFDDVLEGRVELAWTDAGDKKLRHAQSYDVADLDELAAEAAKQNIVEGQNVYVGAALRLPDSAPFGRGNDDDLLAATAFWADLDDAAAVHEAKQRYNGAPPTIGVITGRKPHPRVQLWWK